MLGRDDWFSRRQRQLCLDFLMNVFQRIVTPFMECFRGKLTGQQVWTLCMADLSGPVSVQELAESLHIPKQQASRLTDLLAEEGYLFRRIDQSDRRRLLIAVTPKGEELLDSGWKQFEKQLFQRDGAAASREWLRRAMALSGGEWLEIKGGGSLATDGAGTTGNYGKAGMDMAKKNDFFEITPEILRLSEACVAHDAIDPSLYVKYDVKRGLRDLNGKGVVAGLTEISDIISSKEVNGETVSCEGELYYRGIDIKELTRGFIREKRFGFEETVYLLLFGTLPNQAESEEFKKLLSKYRTLPTNFVRDVVMKAPTSDMMNTLARSVLTLYAYDEKATDTSIPNTLRQCLEMIALFPQLAVYGYQAYAHDVDPENNSFFIHAPRPELSTAENILHMLRIDNSYTELEARILDLALVLHAEHGGGNNSSFTTHVVASSGTDAYSVIAAALGSLKGPRHGGANIKVMRMFEDMKANVKDWEDEEEIRAYLLGLLHKEKFDHSGLIYGMGHAVYSLSDPRADIFRSFVKSLSEEKGLYKEYQLYSLVERLAPKVISEERKIYKGVSANIDFYSGFVYHMLGLPAELFTPVFAMARIAGWSAHLMEEIVHGGKIIRPAYRSIGERQAYVPLAERP